MLLLGSVKVLFGHGVHENQSDGQAAGQRFTVSSTCNTMFLS